MPAPVFNKLTKSIATNVNATIQPMINAASSLVGSISPADILFFDNSLAMPKAISWRTTVGRMKRIGNAIWAKCAANEARIYVNDNGGIEAVMLQPAMTVRGYDWTIAPVDSSSLGWVTCNTLSGVTLSQSRGHTGVDYMGGTGLGFRVITTTTTTQASLRSMTVSNTSGVTKTIAMVYQAICKPDVGGGVKTPIFRLYNTGSSTNNSTCSVTFTEEGTIVNFTNVGGSAGYDLFETLPNGDKVYRIWHKINLTDGQIVAPRVDVVAGCQVRATCYIIEDTLPEVIPLQPVMGTGVFADDGIQLGTTIPLEVQERMAGWGRTRIVNGLITVPKFKSTGSLGRQRRIEVRPSTNNEARDYLVTDAAFGNPNISLDLAAAAAGASQTLFLGEGQFPRISMGSGTNNIRAAHNNPARWPEIIGQSIFGSAVQGGTINGLAFHARTGQGSAPQGTDYVLSFDNATMSIGEVLTKGAYDRWVPQSLVPIEKAMPSQKVTRQYFYRTGMTTRNGATINGARMMAHGVHGGFNFATPTGQVVAYTDCIFATVETTTDANILNLGTLSFDSNCIFFGRDFVPLFYDLWQWQYELEVQTDPGGAWQTLSASGIAPSALARRFAVEQVGTFDGSGNVTYSYPTNPTGRMIVQSLDLTLGTGNKPGYQAYLSFIEYEASGTAVMGYEDRPSNGTVWQKSNPGIISASNPNVRFRHSSYTWASGSAVAKGDRTPHSANAGPHSDLLQFAISANLNVTAMNAWCITFGGRCQGYLDNNSTNVTSNANPKLVVFTDYSNGAVFSGSPSSSVKGVLLPQFSRTRNDGLFTTPQLSYSGTTALDASGLIIGTTSSRGMYGTTTGTLTGVPTAVACGRIVSYSTYTAPDSDQPSLRPSIYDILPAEQIQFGMLKEGINEQNLKLSGQVARLTGLDLQGAVDKVAAFIRRMQPLIDRISLKDPTHTVTIPNTTAVGSALTLLPVDTTRHGTTLVGLLDRIKGGNYDGYFTQDGGTLKIARTLPANTVFALVTNQDEYIRIWSV